MLWNKCKKDGMFIDLLHSVKYPIRNRRIHREKNNSVAMSLRIQGNQLYTQNKFEEAWIQYNESVCFSENDSECLALAYSNRSQCFLKMKMYERCLGDILLVKELQYPKSLIRKLDARQKECVEKSNSVHQISFVPTLSLEPHKKFSTMASVLKIEYNEVYGRLVKARCDIEIGETVVVEKDYIRSVNSEHNNYCLYCGETKVNLVPCKQCADAMFCDKACADNSSHYLECDMQFGSENVCDQQSLTAILRSILIGISTFDNIHEMIEFVEECLCTSPLEISEAVECSKSKYRTFFKLTSFATDQRVLDFRKRAYFVYESIMNSSQHAHMFVTVATQRFLIHLITHHGLILLSNSFAFEEGGVIIEELALISSYFNHSCLPNVAKLTKNNFSIIKTILPIKRDEQLFVTYISGEVFDMTGKERNDSLEKRYGFRCKCKLCTNGRLHTDKLFGDPLFLYVSSNALNDDFVNVNLPTMVQSCKEFLLLYPDMNGSKEIAYIAEILTVLFSKQLSG